MTRRGGDPNRPHVRCTATARNGERCGAYAVTANGGTLCAGHAGLGLGADHLASARKGGATTAALRRRKAQERRMSLLDCIANATEQRAQEIVDAYLQAGLGDKGDWRALEALITRVHGRPVERVETRDETVNVRNMSPEQRHALMARVLDDHPGLAALIPPTAHGPPVP